ncbi:MAG: hypothetical protein ACRDH6_00620 [Actinomycetota bacterium]
MIFELIVGGVFIALGLRSSVVSFRDPSVPGSARIRALVALHDTVKAGFWLALGGLFIGFATLDEPQSFRWFVLVPIAMAGLRLASAALLSRD